MKYKLYAGTTSYLALVYIQDTSSTTGGGLAGLTSATAGLVCKYRRQGQSAWTTITLSAGTLGTWSSGGFIVDSGAATGTYELGIPNAAIATGARQVAIQLYGAANMLLCNIEIELDAVNYQSVATFMTGVNGTAPPVNWNLMSIDANGRVDIGKWLGGTPDALSSGKIPADLKLWLASAPLALSSQLLQVIVNDYAATKAPLQPSVAGRQLDVSATGEAGIDFDNIKQATGATTLNNVTVPTVTTLTGHTPQTGDNFARIGANGAGLTSLASQSSVNTLTSYVDTEVLAIKAKTDNLPSDPASASTIATAFTTVNNALTTISGYIDTEVAAIKAKTDGLPSDPADASVIADSFTAISNALTTLATYVDTEVAAIKAKTDNLPGTPASQSDVTGVGGALITQATDNANAILNAVDAVPTATENADATWTRNTRTLTSGGGSGGATPQEIWEYGTRTLTEGSGGSDFTPEQVTNIDNAATRINATPGDPDEAVNIVPAPVAPAADMVLVYFNPSAFLAPISATAKIGYVNNTLALPIARTVDLTKKKITFAYPLGDNGKEDKTALQYAWVPKSSAVVGWNFYLDCPDANHKEKLAESRFHVPDTLPPLHGDVRYWLMSELLDRTLNPPPTP